VTLTDPTPRTVARAESNANPGEDSPRFRTGVPAYFGPWERTHWAALLEESPEVVVVNPLSGPADAPVHGYAEIVSQLLRNGSKVLGYVAVGFGAKSFVACKHELERYADWYGVTSAFIDEVAVEGHRTPPRLLLDLARHVAQVGEDAAMTVFNPGRVIPNAWFRSLPTSEFVTFEGTLTQHGARFGAGQVHIDGPAHRQWHLVHECPPTKVRALRKRLSHSGVGVSYVTSDRLPNPWDVFESQRS
jgi:Spherulation-specific family 4